jgi:surfactin synthase thioesterase subunit
MSEYSRPHIGKQQPEHAANAGWFRQFPGAPGTAGVRLYCFPHAGGAASAYVPLSRRLSPDVEVLAVQYPGRQDRRLEPPVTAITELADHIAWQLRPAASAGPYALFGHSMGALLAYETARRLRQWSAPGPVRLFLSGRGAPTRQPSAHDQVTDDTGLRAAIRRLGATDTRMLDDPELAAMVMPALRADYQALASYVWRPGPPLDHPLTVLVGDRDPVVTTEEARAWCSRFTGDFDFRVLPGGHFYLDQKTDEVARVVTAALGAMTKTGRT